MEECHIFSYKKAIILFLLLIVLGAAISILVSAVPKKDILTAKEREWLNSHSGAIIVNSDPDWPPYQFVDKDNLPTGIVTDFYKLIEQKLDFKFIPDKPVIWDKGLNRLISKKIDVACNISESEERKKHILFTRPFLEVPMAIIVKKNRKKDLDLSQMGGMKVSVVKNTLMEKYLVENYPSINIDPQKNSTTCLFETSTGNSDAAAISTAAAAYIIEKQGIPNLRIAGETNYSYKIAFGVRNDWPILKDILEKGIDSVSESEKIAIYKKWVNLDIIPFYKTTTFWIIVLSLFVTSSSLIIIIIIWNYNLKKAVKERTLDIQKRETQLRTLIETIPELVWLKDLQGRYISCNPRMEKYLGAKESEIIGKTDYDFVKKEEADLFRFHDKQAISKGSPIVHENETIFKDDGHKEFQETIKTPMLGPEGEIMGVLGIGRDITQRKKMEIDLRNNQDQLESILSNIQGMTFRCKLDDNWTMTYLSSHVKELTGYPPEIFINNLVKTYESIILEEDKEIVEKTINKAVELKEPWEVDYRIRHKDNNIYWVSAKGAAVFDEKGEIEYLDGFVININDKKIMENHFNQAQKMEAIGTLAGGIAHDFNNILSGILGFTELLQDDLKEINAGDKITKKVDYILKGCTRASELVTQILAFSRSERGESKPIRTRLIAKEIINFLRATLPATIKIEHNLNSHGTVMGDPGKIHQLLMNLCTNAGYAMKGKSGILTIGLDDINIDKKDINGSIKVNPGNFVRISVKDTGCGMDHGIQDKIMAPFFTTKPRGIGTGMGLWVVNGIVKEMEGFIEIESEPEKGTLFKVNLPAISTEIDSDTSSQDKIITKGKGSLLFIDDEESLIQIATTALKELGYDVTALSSGISAIQLFEEYPEQFDLVITDMTMPDITGYLICKRIKKISPKTPVILYSGVMDNEDKDIDFKIFDTIMRKPVLISDLAAGIQKLLDPKSRERIIP